jgi:hypothetical protein
MRLNAYALYGIRRCPFLELIAEAGGVVQKELVTVVRLLTDSVDSVVGV